MSKEAVIYNSQWDALPLPARVLLRSCGYYGAPAAAASIFPCTLIQTKMIAERAGKEKLPIEEWVKRSYNPNTLKSYVLWQTKSSILLGFLVSACEQQLTTGNTAIDLPVKIVAPATLATALVVKNEALAIMGAGNIKTAAESVGTIAGRAFFGSWAARVGYTSSFILSSEVAKESDLSKEQGAALAFGSGLATAALVTPFTHSMYNAIKNPEKYGDSLKAIAVKAKEEGWRSSFRGSPLRMANFAIFSAAAATGKRFMDEQSQGIER